MYAMGSTSPYCFTSYFETKVYFCLQNWWRIRGANTEYTLTDANSFFLFKGRGSCFSPWTYLVFVASQAMRLQKKGRNVNRVSTFSWL